MIAKINTFDPAEPKPFWASKTLWGAAIGAIGLVAGFFGYTIDQETQAVLIEQTTAAIAAGAALFGTVLVVIGRFSAQRPVRVLPPDDE